MFQTKPNAPVAIGASATACQAQTVESDVEKAEQVPNGMANHQDDEDEGVQMETGRSTNKVVQICDVINHDKSYDVINHEKSGSVSTVETNPSENELVPGKR